MFRNHVIMSSSTQRSTTAVERGRDSAHDQQVYSTLLRLRDTVCAEVLRTLAADKNKDDPGNTLNSLKKDVSEDSHLHLARNEVCFLLNDSREPRAPPASAGEVPISHSTHRDVSRGRSSESVLHSSSSQAVSTPHASSATRHSHAQRGGGMGVLVRQASRDSQQQSHDLVELEEDDDEGEHMPVFVPPPRPRRGRHVSKIE